MPHHPTSSEQHIPGVTHDPVLRPVGALMVVVGAIWALFFGMAVEAGTLAQPLAAVSLIALGLLLAAVGKREIQI
jgi:hypothetical protein